MRDFLLSVCQPHTVASFGRDLTILIDLSPHEGVSFNGNILETNILNLSVVVGVVVTFGGDALRSLLDNRKNLIANTLQQAEERAREARQRVERAESELASARRKADQIREQGILAAEREQAGSISRREVDIAYLHQLKEEAVGLQQQRAVREVSQQVVALALSQVRERLASRFDLTFHQSINSFNTVLFNNYKPR